MPVNTGLLGLGASHGNDLATVFMIPKRKGYLIWESRVALFDMEETHSPGAWYSKRKKPPGSQGALSAYGRSVRRGLTTG